MKKPLPSDFALNDESVKKFENVETDFFRDRDAKANSEGHIPLFWLTFFCVASGLQTSSGILLIVGAISGIWCAVSFVDKSTIDFQAKPKLTIEYINFKNALRDYEAYLRDFNEKQKQLEKEKEKAEKIEKRKTYEYWITIDPYQFEYEVAMLFKNHGFDVKVTKGSGDQGIDIKLFKNGKRGAVQCKRYTSKVGPSTARDLYGAMMHGKYEFGFIVCPSSFSESTFEFTKKKPITLIGLKRIIEMTNDDEVDFLRLS
jgi:hypothetical protein